MFFAYFYIAESAIFTLFSCNPLFQPLKALSSEAKFTLKSAGIRFLLRIVSSFKCSVGYGLIIFVIASFKIFSASFLEFDNPSTETMYCRILFSNFPFLIDSLPEQRREIQEKAVLKIVSSFSSDSVIVNLCTQILPRFYVPIHPDFAHKFHLDFMRKFRLGL